MVLDLVGHQEGKRIASQADIETVDTVHDNLDYYREKDFSYVPIPADGQYFDVEADTSRELSEQQILPDDVHLIEVMALLRNHPFVLLDYHGVLSDQSDLAEKLGIQREESERYGIITLADLDTRQVKQMLYPAVDTFEHELAGAVRRYYPDSDVPDDVVSDKTWDRWDDAKDHDVATHVVEHMQLTELKETVRETGDLREACGFGSKTQVDNTLGGLIQVRHQVMHPPRPMVRDRDELETALDRLSRIKTVLEHLRESSI